MAKKKTTRKRSTRSFTNFKRRTKRAMSKPEAVIVPSMVYGGLREKASNLLSPISSKIPFGSIADEITMGFASYMLAKKGKGMLKKVGIAGLTIESARLGEAIADGSLGVFGNTTSTTIENSATVF